MDVTLLDFFQKRSGQKIPRQDVAQFLNVTKRTAQKHVNKLNEQLSEAGSRFLVCSSTESGEFSESKVDKSGYCYTDNPVETKRCYNQLRSHALGELKKLRVVKLALKRQVEYELKRMPPPVVEQAGQIRLF